MTSLKFGFYKPDVPHVQTAPITSPFGNKSTDSDADAMPFFSSHIVRTSLLALFLLLIIVPYLRSVYVALTSPLCKIPGPWYAPYTSLHLRYLFARGTIWKYVENQHKVFGGIMRLGPRQLWVSDKECLKGILMTTDLPKVTMYAEISRDRYSPGLFGEIREKPHRNLKRFLGSAFTVSSVDRLDTFFKSCVSTLIRNYYRQLDKCEESKRGDGIQADLMRDLHCLALDIMGESAFGRGFGQIDKVFEPSKSTSQDDKDWSKIPDDIFDGLAARYQTVFFKRLLRKFGLNLKFDWPKTMTRAISKLVDGRKSGEIECPVEKDVLQHMLDNGNRPDTGDQMSNQDIIDQMSELLLAGSETTSGTIACLFLEIARNKRVKDKLLASLPVLGPDDPIIDSKTVREQPQFEYLEACIQENLRMHPIASEMGRRTVNESFNAEGHVIPPHTVVSASYRQLHLNEEFWPQADTFLPERWLKEDERGGAPEPDRDAYYPFSAGKHACIGKNFAMAEIRTVSANMFSRFEVEDVARKSIDFRQFITMQFCDGSWSVTLKPRAQLDPGEDHMVAQE